MPRQPIGKKLRFSILSRDGFTCRYCGAKGADGVELQIDHIIPVVEGGTNDPENLITACQPCNAGKSGQRPEAALPDEAERSVRREEAIAALKRIAYLESGREAFRQTVCNLWCQTTGRTAMDRGTLTTITRYAQEVGLEKVGDWIEIAVGRLGPKADWELGRYVSGIRRRTLEREREQQNARALATAMAEEGATLDDR